MVKVPVQGFSRRSRVPCLERFPLHDSERLVLKKKKGKRRGKRRRGEGEVYVVVSGPSPITPARERLRLQLLIWQPSEASEFCFVCFFLVRIFIGWIPFACMIYLIFLQCGWCADFSFVVPLDPICLEVTQAVDDAATDLWLQMHDAHQQLMSLDAEDWCCSAAL